MIDLFTWPTPNGQKVSIALEVLGLPYAPIAVDITKGEQFAPDFLEISPNNKIPALVDRSDDKKIVVFESGAILLYLAEKTGELLPKEGPDRYECLQWLQFQMGGVGPMFGQAGHYAIFAKEPNPSALERYTRESQRILGVLDRHLRDRDFVAGGKLSIADIALFPWIRRAGRYGIALETYQDVSRWVAHLEKQPSFKRGLEVLADRSQPVVTDEERENLFGSAQFNRGK